MTAVEQVQGVLNSATFRVRLLETAGLDVGPHGAEDLAQQLSLESLRAAAKQERLDRPEAFVWGCYKRCKRDAIRKTERDTRRAA